MKFLRIALPVLLVAAMALCLASCGLHKEPVFEYDGEGFVARVVKVEGNSLLVEPANSDAPEARSSDRFTVPNYFEGRVRKGDTVVIRHNGMIQETYPASFNRIFEMILVGDDGTNESVIID